ncbi:MAG: amidase, partial [Alphaproteobacteria bacterium]
MIDRGALSPVDLTQACLDRIEKLDGKVNAVLRTMPERALAAARAAEAEIHAGRRRGPLHGVPYGLKDIIDIAGEPTTAHSKVLAQQPPVTTNAAVTDRLEAAGGVCVAKLSTWEFAVGGPSFDLPWPPARNPWDLERTPGGSSSGSGAGLAARFFPAALGTDTGGSVRNPAASCGVVGLKPTYGRVPLRGVLPLSTSLDHVGPMTRTVADNAILFQAIAGPDPEDPTTFDAPVPDVMATLGEGVAGLKIGVIRHFWERDGQA